MTDQSDYRTELPAEYVETPKPKAYHLEWNGGLDMLSYHLIIDAQYTHEQIEALPGVAGIIHTGATVLVRRMHVDLDPRYDNPRALFVKGLNKLTSTPDEPEIDEEDDQDDELDGYVDSAIDTLDKIAGGANPADLLPDNTPETWADIIERSKETKEFEQHDTSQE